MLPTVLWGLAILGCSCKGHCITDMPPCCGAWQYRAVNVRVTVIQTCYHPVGPGNIGLLTLESLFYRHATNSAMGPGNIRLLL